MRVPAPEPGPPVWSYLNPVNARPPRRTGVLVGAAAVLVLLIGGLVWFTAFRGDSGGTGARSVDRSRQAAVTFAADWQAGKLTPGLFTTGNEAVAKTAFVTAGLQAVGGHPQKVVLTAFDRPPVVKDAPGRGVATMRVTWDLGAGRAWTYDTKAQFQEMAAPTEGDKATSTASIDAEPTWKVAWIPALVEPSLVEGEVLTAARLPAARGDLLGVDGQSLTGGGSSSGTGKVEVGIQPRRATDPAGTARTVAALLKVDPVALVKKVQAAAPDAFVSVIVLDRAAYNAIKSQIQPLPGTMFREQGQPGPSTALARALLGTVGSATKDLAAKSGGAIAEGDQVGLSGLQAAQQAKLGGTPGLIVRAAPADPGAPSLGLKSFDATPGQPITLTLDRRIQAAADAAIAGTANPSALVVIRPSTGDVLAVANGPSNQSGYNRAMVGHYPPGSTFKVASGLTLFQQGLTLDATVQCPATITVGKVFRNAEGEVLGPVPFRKDFANSCNTAFIGQSRTITAQQLTDTATSLGYRKLDVGAPLFGGSVPVATDPTEHAADMIGQGQVEASPFAVALASASVAAGRTLTPRLIVDPASPAPAPGATLPVGPIAALREAMRGVVTDGTGTALKGVPGGDVFGKTGTAEFGTATPPQTHAWFTGYQGDLAFAVLVEDGGFGGAVAAPLAARFLTTLAGG
jgi:cell division protein FtsI/penicillin-binding protein 2